MVINDRLINIEDSKLKMRLSIHMISNICVFFFLFFAVFMPADNLNLKKIFFVLTIVFNFPVIIKYFFTPKFFLNNIMTYFFPVFFIFTSVVFLSNDFMTAFQIGHIALYFAVFFIVFDAKETFFGYLLFILKMMTGLIVFSGMLHYIGILDVNSNFILDYLYTTDNALVGYGFVTTSFGVMIFLKASPLILILLGDACSKNDTKWVVASTLALMLSGTRANFFVALAICVYYFWVRKNKSQYVWILKFIFVFVCLFTVVVAFGDELYDVIIDIFVRRKSNDTIRNGYYADLFYVLEQKPYAFFTGTGFGSYMYVSGANVYANIIELSYWDLFRQIGLIGFIPMLIFIITPVFKCFATNKWMTLSYISYLVIAYTNPLLYTSTSYIIYIFMYLLMYSDGGKKAEMENVE